MKVEAEYRKLKLSVESWKWVQKVEINHSNTWRSLYNDGNVAWDTVTFNKGKQELRTQKIADGDQKLSWQLCFKESEDFPREWSFSYYRPK